MNTSLAKFLGLAITAVCISAFLFFIGYNMIGAETNDYKTQIENQVNNLPDGSGTPTNN